MIKARFYPIEFYDVEIHQKLNIVGSKHHLDNFFIESTVAQIPAQGTIIDFSSVDVESQLRKQLETSNALHVFLLDWAEFLRREIDDIGEILDGLRKINGTIEQPPQPIRPTLGTSADDLLLQFLDNEYYSGFRSPNWYVQDVIIQAGQATADITIKGDNCC